MNILLRSKIGRRFTSMFVLLFVPIVAAGWFGILSGTRALQKQTHAVLRAASDGAEAELREFLLSLRRTAEEVSRDRELVTGGALGGNSKGLERLLTHARALTPEVQEIVFLNADGRTKELGDDGGVPPALCYERGKQGFYAGDVERDNHGQLRWWISAAVRNRETGAIDGVLALSIDPEVLTRLVTGKRVLEEGADTQSFRIGATGETYLVNRDGYLLTESRFTSDGVLRQKVDTEPVRAARERGEEILRDYKDYRGVEVSGSTAILRDMGWVLITEIDFSQVFAPITALRNGLIWLGMAIVLVALLIGQRFVVGIVQPLQLVTDANRRLAGGTEEAALVPEQGLPQNEIGEFVKSRNRRLQQLVQRQQELVREQTARAETAAELQRIAYGMVHDMRAPLRAIVTFGDLVKHSAQGLGEAERDFLTRMRGAAVRMDQLICAVMKYSSLLRRELSLQAVDLCSVVQRVIASTEAFQQARERIRVEHGIPPVMGNSDILEECVAALLENALKYGKPGIPTAVQIKAEKLERRVRLVVEDDGVGMTKEFQKRVFGIFERGTDEASGTGIGLALVRVAVQRMGGTVGMTSEEGKGSRFWMELRQAEAAQRASDSGVGAEQKRGPAVRRA